ncbi:hypothetical protein [Argonema antarcticum]|uniref:hypothetical protein n=1 Tax=Argonema antarcticum TaxID=2942763 RepID=UPI00201122B5|nr:hypothetical protein [Argonema antarcticum]MCL1474680.1 hypothetical protein [Argonema antarcticum A004/B2]
MNVTRTTSIAITGNSYVSSSINHNNGTANLFIAGNNESIIIQLLPENLPILRDLVAALQQLEADLQQANLEKLQCQIHALQNHNGKAVTLVADNDTF